MPMAEASRRRTVDIEHGGRLEGNRDTKRGIADEQSGVGIVQHLVQIGRSFGEFREDMPVGGAENARESLRTA